MERALNEIKSLIELYDYKVRDCHPYFKESEDKFKERKNELVETLNELRQSFKILSNERETVRKHEHNKELCSLTGNTYADCCLVDFNCNECKYRK